MYKLVRSEKLKRLERLKVRPGEIPLPPMPTVSPQPAEFVPIIEKLSPELLAQLRASQVI